MKYETPFSREMRAPCKYGCDCTLGNFTTTNGQDVVRCCNCGKAQYNAPKTETGRAVRSVSTTHAALRPKMKVAILERANGRCEMCGNGPPKSNLHVGHIISVKLGMDDMTDAELNDEENLVCLCDECNLGMGDEPLPLRFMMKLVRARIMHRQETAV